MGIRRGLITDNKDNISNVADHKENDMKITGYNEKYKLVSMAHVTRTILAISQITKEAP